MKPNCHSLWFFSGIALCLLATTSRAEAQIVPDATLPVNSNVTTQGNTSIINGGTSAGSNLFHSFEQFSVPTGGGAYFNNALYIQNIISRVTGSSISSIDGLIRANGTANLFLLNPNGIIFGPNASLNIGGSFLGSTASSINFADGSQFSATGNPTTQLLTVSVPIGLQFGGTAGSILNQSRTTNSSGQRAGLQVLPGKTLSLVGGDVRLDGGRLEALGGRVELGGVAGAGTVGLVVDRNNLLMSFPDGVAQADVYLTNSGSNTTARINVAASNSGSIAINARNIEISGGSLLNAGLGRGLGFPGAQAGDIELRAQGAINITNSFIFNNVGVDAVGNSGSINIMTGSLFVTDGAQLQSITRGQGHTGSVNINARDTVSFDGVGSSGFSSLAASAVEAGAVGNAGSINITTGSLSVTDGAGLAATTFGTGNAGNLNINASDTVSFDGVGSDGFSGSAFSQVGAGALGNGGDINITTRSLSLTNGVPLQASTSGRGNAGSVNIYVRDTVSFDGSVAFSTVESTAAGNGGDINIATGSLSFTNGAALVASTRGQGNAGSVNIAASDTVSFDGVGNNVFNIPAFRAAEIGERIEGSVTINVRDPASLTGESPNLSPSGVLSQVESRGVGNAGNIRITAGSLSVTNGAVLTASTNGQGAAGNVTINAATFEADGGGQVLTTTSSANNAGNITINSTDSINLFGSASGLFANTTPNSTGDSGTISINSIQLNITDGAGVAVDSQGEGNAGNLLVQADSVTLDREAFLSAAATSGKGGNIRLDTQDLLLMRRNSGIFATSGSPENEGNIAIDTDLLAALENSDIRANAFAGPGANIKITAQAIFGTQAREQLSPESDITATGVVELVTLVIDPSQGLANLPAQLVEASGQVVAQGCSALGENEFIVTGRGGLPPSPTDTLSSDTVWTDLRPLTQQAETRPSSEKATQPTNSIPEQLVEAQGWVINDKGEVVLTAHAPNDTPNIPCGSG